MLVEQACNASSEVMVINLAVKNGLHLADLWRPRKINGYVSRLCDYLNTRRYTRSVLGLFDTGGCKHTCTHKDVSLST